jgi:hypothetical protein
MSMKIRPILEGEKVIKDGRSPLVPQGPTFRAAIIGRTGSGKSQLVANMICRGWIPTTIVYLCLRAPDQSVYKAISSNIINAVAKENEAIAKRNAALSDSDSEEEGDIEPDEVLQIVTSPEQLPNIDNLHRDEPTLFIFDDFITEIKELPLIEQFFTRGRNAGASSVFLTQGFYEMPKLIRRNCEYFFLFGGLDDREIGQLHKNLGQGLSLKQFKSIYTWATKKTTQDTHPFLMIDFKTDKPPLKFRRGFDQLVINLF